MLAMVDANARVGSIPSPNVGMHQAETQNEAGEVWHQWLQDEDLVLPQTFEQHHTGYGHTWHHASGSTARIDYVALSRCLFQQCAVRTCIADIDLTLKRQDHLAVLLEIDLHMRLPVPVEQDVPQPVNLDFSWGVDAHTHAAHLQMHLRSKYQQPKCKLRPFRPHMSSSTWQIILAKKYHWRRRKHLVHTLRHSCLRALFHAWAHKTSSHDCAPWLRLTHKSIAFHEAQLQTLSKKVNAALLADDRHYYSTLAEQAGEAADAGLHGLWKQVKHILPKQTQKRKSSLKCVGPDASELSSHYCELEAGEPISYATLLQQCFQRQKEMIFDAPLSTDLASFPTRLDLEKLCRRAKNGKAPGIDGLTAEALKLSLVHESDLLHQLIFKIWATGSEPLQFKGGLIWSIAKRPGATTVENLRGIMLLEVLGKAFHALLRKHLLQWTLPCKLTTQFGGYAGQQIAFPTLTLRSFIEHAAEHRVSTAVIFLDIKSAFHCLLRQIVFGTQDSFPEVLRNALHAEGFDVDALQARIAECSTEFCSTAHPLLARAASDAHLNTWFIGRVNTDDTCFATHRGSRPGSPVADIAYNILMSSILRSIEAKLEAHPLIQEAFDLLHMKIPIVTWVDDVSIPVPCVDGSQLLALTQDLMQAIVDTFTLHGLRLNLSKGKTEILMQHRGKGAPLLRKQLLQDEFAQIPIKYFDQEVPVRVVGAYKHLGSLMVSSLSIAHDVKCRMARAETNFRTLSRALFHNRKINVCTRLSLLEALVLPMIIYGCGHWPLLPHQVFIKLNHLILKWQRSIIGSGYWSDDKLPDWRLQARWQLLPLAVRLCKHRLQFALQLVKKAPALVWEFATANDRFDREGTWLHALRHALNWYRFDILDSDQNVIPEDPLTAESLAQWLQGGGMATPSRINRAVQRFIFREHVAEAVLTKHNDIAQTLIDVGIDFTLTPQDDEKDCTFACDLCSKRFTTAQGLNTHRWVVHQAFSLERKYIHSTTCLASMQQMFLDGTASPTTPSILTSARRWMSDSPYTFHRTARWTMSNCSWTAWYQFVSCPMCACSWPGSTWVASTLGTSKRIQSWCLVFWMDLQWFSWHCDRWISTWDHGFSWSFDSCLDA